MNSRETLQALQGVGLSKKEEEMVLITDEPKYPGFLCFANDKAQDLYDTKGAYGQGFDTIASRSRVKAVGEFLERLCLQNVTDDLIAKKFTSSNGCVDPGMFCSYSSEQVDDVESFKESSRKEEYRWWDVENLTLGKRMLIPGQFVSLSKLFNDEFPIRRERISTGAALGPIGTNHALQGGFFEAIERDACAPAYLMRRKLARIVDYPEKVEQISDYLSRYNLETYLFDATTDLGIPTVLAITIDETGIGGAVNTGSRSDLNYKDAMVRAMMESVQCRRTGRILQALEWPDRLPSEDEITSMNNRFYYWNGLERIKDLSFWLDNDQTVSYKHLSRKSISFQNALNSIFQKNYNMFVADLTLPEVRKAGFECLKVVIPELHPMYLDERAKVLYSVHYGEIKDDSTLKPHPMT